MRSLVESAFDLRQPEYTGENRCLPCTVVNVALAAVLSAGVGVVTAAPVGVAAFLGCLVAIYLRGYLVPGTPTLTERYLPASVLRLFGKDALERRTIADRTDDAWDALVAAAVATRSADGTLALSEAFRDRLRRELRSSRETTPTAADVAAIVDADEVSRQGPRTFSVDGARLLEWDSEAALHADRAAASVLETWVDDWDALESGTRRELLRRLRLLLDRCPACDGPVARESERVDPCCQPAHVFVWTRCPACDARLAEVGVPERDADELAVVDGVGEAPFAQ